MGKQGRVARRFARQHQLGKATSNVALMCHPESCVFFVDACNLALRFLDKLCSRHDRFFAPALYGVQRSLVSFHASLCAITAVENIVYVIDGPRLHEAADDTWFVTPEFLSILVRVAALQLTNVILGVL